MDALRRDLRYAFRTLGKSPGFLLAAVVTLSLAIGLNATVFSVVDGLALRPLPVAAPGELVSIFSARRAIPERSSLRSGGRPARSTSGSP